MNTSITRMMLAFAAVAVATSATTGEAQVVYYQTFRPMVAAPMVGAPVMASPYVANYTPAGNYAAVTAFSPPVMMAPSSTAVTAGFAPVAAPMPVTAFSSPTVAFSPVVAAAPVPVTTFYAPTAVVAPVYRRGLFGVWRPTRTGYFIPY